LLCLRRFNGGRKKLVRQKQYFYKLCRYPRNQYLNHYLEKFCFCLLGASRPTNRRLLNREVVWEWRQEWKILADFKAEFKNFALRRERSERIPCAHNTEGFMWSSLLDIGRTFFKEKVQN